LPVLAPIEQFVQASYRAGMLARPTIVLTGFGPYPGVPINASAMLVPRVAKSIRTLFPNHDTVIEILPTQWSVAPTRLQQLVKTTNLVLMLHFGVSRDAQGFQLELVGRNLQTSLEDAAGHLPRSTRIAEEGPDLLATTLPAERIAARLMGLGLPCSTSDNAGTYLCNALLYHSLAAARGAPAPHLAGFVHVPTNLVGHGPEGQDPHPDCPLDWRAAVSGALEIIAACLDYLVEQRPPVKPG
jgi:pyroglutamyl-peptidase